MITLPIENAKGHILIPMDGNRYALIDTGSPASMAPEPFEFLGERHAPPNHLMGITPAQMAELAGIPIDILIGCDILSRHTLRFRWRENALDAGDDVPHGPIASAMATLMGIPAFPLILQGQSTHALFDTGAHLSYIDPDWVAGETPSGQREDFYPLIGRFDVATYLIATALDQTPIDLAYGTLPNSLQMMLGMALAMFDASAIIGTEILEHFDCTLSWPNGRISWQRR